MNVEAGKGDRQEWERLDWDTAEEHPGVASGFFLVVKGVSRVPMTVELHPLPIPIAPEDYYGVEVRGVSAEPSVEVETPWTVERDSQDLPHGRKGYILIGATKRKHFPPKDDED